MTNLGSNFYSKLLEISSELGMKPEDLLAVMVSESGLNPAAHEQKYNGGGLVGFMPDTLKGLGFKGSPEDFRKLNGASQLDWLKKLVQGYMNGVNHGKPFTSAADYYVANFVPAALLLPGIKAKDPNCAFVEEHPRAIKDPKTGNLYSKKYYEVGVKLDPKTEKSFYDANTLFHGSKAGAITYGDMLNQVNKNRQNPLYQQAIKDMHAQTGYEAKQPSQVSHEGQTAVNYNKKETPNTDDSWLDKIKHFISQFIFASQDNNKYLISVGSSQDKYTTFEYARIFAQAINDYYKTETSLHLNHNDVEISCNIAGDKIKICAALKELNKSLSEAFQTATIKIGSPITFAQIMVGLESDLPLVHPRQADLNYIKFKSKIRGTK